MTARNILTCLFLAGAGSALSGAAVLSLRDSRGDVLIRPTNTSRINWTSGYASAQATTALPRIVNDRSDPDFGQPGTARSLSEARAIALASARSRAGRELVYLIGGLRLDSEYILLERLKKDRSLRQRFGSIHSRFRLRSTRTGEGRVSVEIGVPFRGPTGLYAMLVDQRYDAEPVPAATADDLEDQITGLIVDASQLNSFRPSLEIRIYTDRGRRIYGPETIGRRCAVRRGVITYARTRENAAEKASLGLYPYYTFAAGLVGPGHSDIFLAGDDVRRILGSKGGRRALRTCSVAVLTPAR